ncbi:UpxY family transcription antiterminator [uncultured Bacteroides sp.]|uniref:UpxY family transcription antiterminator n=1 Tax=uncultured Bacteroides sp. TaxID=162156 RepID=UPI002AA7B079|nr:UpxY family transcription antiterminator [uncultured Bacteroides sp.]
MIVNQMYWFAARTRANQEISLRESLKKLNVAFFLPTQFVTRIYSDRRKRVEVPVISNLIFVKCTKADAFALVKNYSLKLSYMKDIITGSLLVIPDQQMEHFMLAMNSSSAEASMCEGDTCLSKGDKVRVIKGDLTGFEGELVRISGKTYVILRIPQILTISIKIPRNHLQKLAPSVTGDKRNIELL